ncbi:MAG: hypothetical protein ABIO72_02665 [Patescibacteria group bacterium]
MSMESLPSSLEPAQRERHPSHHEREIQKKEALKALASDHEGAFKEFEAAKDAREKRRAEVFQVHVACMDERNTFASEATGEPLGSMELFASVDGALSADHDPKTGADAFLKMYGDGFRKAKEEGKERVVWLMPHSCSGDSDAGCAGFATDEDAQRAYFRSLASELASRPELEGAKIHAAMYDTDTNELASFDGQELPLATKDAVSRLQITKGIVGDSEEPEHDQAHAGNRLYVGTMPRVWTAERNHAYHLSSLIERDELLSGITLAVNAIKTHSHVDTNKVPIVIQLDRSNEQPGLEISNEELLTRLNLQPDEAMVVRSQTDPERGEGHVAQTGTA